MKTLPTIWLPFVMSMLFQSSLFAQPTTTTSTSKQTKRELMENLISTTAFLNSATNTQFSEETRLNTFNWAIAFYESYKKAFEKIKPKLSPETKSQLDMINNVYGQICTKQGFQYMLDINTVTALLIGGAKIDMIMESMLK